MNHIRGIVLACERGMEVFGCWVVAVGASNATFEYQNSSKMTWEIEVDKIDYIWAAFFLYTGDLDFHESLGLVAV